MISIKKQVYFTQFDHVNRCILTYKAKRQYLLTAQVSRYCLSAPHSSIITITGKTGINGPAIERVSCRLFQLQKHVCFIHFDHLDRCILLCKAKRQYLLTLQVSRYCLSALHSSITTTTGKLRKKWHSYRVFGR